MPVRRPLLPALLTALLTAALTAGCAAPPGPGDGGPAPATDPGTATATATATATEAPAGPALPWPARSAAEATGLQQAVDAGAQPWLLDPEETALSYAAAAYGWDAATTERTDAATVVVTGPGGSRRTLALVQPARPGPGGIWSVVAER